jgi:predicted transcriptional regulator
VNVRHAVTALGLEVASGAAGLDREITGGYASDMLSCVMAGAGAGQIWVTLQAHPNVVAVCDLLGLSAVIITEGARPDATTLDRAEERGIPVLTTTRPTFAVVGDLVALGVKGDSARRGG